MKRLHNQETCTDCDLAMWRKIQNLRLSWLRIPSKRRASSLLSAELPKAKDNDTVSKLKVEMGATMEELKTLYHDYKQNIID